ncbi:MAG: hypothetical protein KF713_18890 [Turneriella sp.]|nr:hypothetical protein [Turneriella sp.]
MSTKTVPTTLERKSPPTLIDLERLVARRDTPFQNGTLEFTTGRFVAQKGTMPLGGNHRPDSQGVYENLEFLEFLHSTITQLGSDGQPTADPEDCLRALQRALGGALFLTNPHPSVICITGNTARYLLLEVLQRALGERALYLCETELEQLSSLKATALWRLANARLLLIDIPRRVTDAEKDRLTSLLFRTFMRTGLEQEPFHRPFSAIPVLFTPDLSCADPTGLSEDPSAVQAFTLLDGDRTSLSLHQHLIAASAQDQIDLFLRWLLDGARLEEEFRKEPENRPVSRSEIE